MELPKRSGDDRFVAPGAYGQLERRVGQAAARHDIPVLFVYAFDRRTAIGPYVFTDKLLIPGAVSSVAAALYSAGLTNVRVVMQPWNPRIRADESRLGGRPPQLLLISAMQIHSAPAYRLIRDAWRLGAGRPLIVAGGPKAIYEPWDFFGLSEDGAVGADVVVTGEEYVLLELLERLLDFKRPGDSLLEAFRRARRAGALEDVPGLVYRPDDGDGHPPYLINTGIQRLVADLDELPTPLAALGLFEPPHRGRRLARRPVPMPRLSRYTNILTVVPSRGCRFRCTFCPIPAYNQSTYRYKSGERLAQEMASIAQHTGIHTFFGCDDNFFNRRSVTEEILEAMARSSVRGRPFRDAIAFATEATEADVYKHRDLLPLARQAGLRSLYFGIEDLTAKLVKKGQSAEKTEAVFRALVQHDIAPMPMMIHYDGQPLWSRDGLAGLLNQIRFLHRTGAISCQITLLIPMTGSRSYERLYQDGLVLSRVGTQPVEDYMYDGNRTICTRCRHPWLRQINMLLGYAAFYNPLNLARALLQFDGLRGVRIFFQVMGMAGLVKSLWVSRADLARLIIGPIQRHAEAPRAKYRMVLPAGEDVTTRTASQVSASSTAVACAPVG
ncbi:MAG TPA: radical SAM protein [Planctomycetaceae bacterium]|nr:radical SAM protein [Planctomycetaceae bacterium]HIQ20279.1 radical SAM protein [Planctomycetota bacterium]